MALMLIPLAIATVGILVAVGLPLLLVGALAVASPQTGPSAEARNEIPAILLAHYQRAPACEGLPWQIVAAIGYVESRHGSEGGAHLDPVTGEVAPHIVGIALDGTDHTARVRAPAGGSPWHGDPIWDHAVGMMQFLTATWATWGVDASGDKAASPHNAFDAVAAAGRYLCNHKTRLEGSDAIAAAIRRYNNSSSYVEAVLAKAIAYGMSDGGDPVGPIPSGTVPPGAGPMIRGTVAPVLRYALAHVGDPYVWGAEGPNAFDCSGLTLAAYRQVGIRLPHKSALQVRFGRNIDWRRESIHPGDLLFLRGGVPVQDYGHVGIALDAGSWIVSPRAGEYVKIGRMPYGRLQAVRRLVAE